MIVDGRSGAEVVLRVLSKSLSRAIIWRKKRNKEEKIEHAIRTLGDKFGCVCFCSFM
jgi:hypothetical protein